MDPRASHRIRSHQGSRRNDPNHATAALPLNGWARLFVIVVFALAVASTSAQPCGIVPGTIIVYCESTTPGDADTYRVIIPYAGVQAGVIVVNNSGSGIVEGHDPAVVSNGTIQVNNISELHDYSVTFSSPCASYTISGTAPACDPPLGTLLINEVDYDNPGTDNDEWIELFNPGPGPVNTEAFWILLVNGGNGTVYQTIQYLGNIEVPAGGYFVIGNNAANPAVDLVVGPASNWLQNGAPDAIALYRVWDQAVVDAISYEGSTAAPYLEGTGFTGADDNVTVGKVIARMPDGQDTNDNNADWQVWCATPGASNNSPSDDDGDGIPNCLDPCPLAVEGILNFDENNCACELSYYATFTDNDGHSVITGCTLCPPGHYCPNGLVALPCPANSYQDQPGQSNCLACPNGESSQPGAVECVPGLCQLPDPGATTGPSTVCFGVDFELGLENGTFGAGVSYQWYVSTVSSNGPWSPIGYNAPTYTTSLSTTSWYYAEVTCAGEGTTASNVLHVSLVPAAACFCLPVISEAVLPICRVEFAGIQNETTPVINYPGDEHYMDYTNLPPGIVLSGGSYLLKVSGTSNGNSAVSWCSFYAHFDWNRDGVFETSHLIGTLPSTLYCDTFLTANIPVPTNAVAGLTRMRILKSKIYDPSNPCGTYANGQVEDYALIVQDCPVVSTSVEYDCDIGIFTTSVNVTDLGAAAWVDIISSIHGTIGNSVGYGIHSSLPTGFGIPETLIVMDSGLEGCSITVGPINSEGSECPSVLVPNSGSNAIHCGNSTTLRDHAGSGSSAVFADGYTVIEASGTATIHISGYYDTGGNGDYIHIYDGQGVNGALLQTYSGTGIADLTGAPGQTLTVRFVSPFGYMGHSGLNFWVSYTGECACTNPVAIALPDLDPDCDSYTSTATVVVSSIGDAASVNIFSSVHGIIASQVGPGSYPSLPTIFLMEESFTVVNSANEECAIDAGSVIPYEPSCPPVLVPFAGNNAIPCGNSTWLLDHGGFPGSYDNYANGFTVLHASGTATIHISGAFTTEVWDSIRIYDGLGLGGTLLQVYSGTGTANFTGAPGQTLTMQFESNVSVNDAGFEFMVHYTGACACAAPLATASVTDDCADLNYSVTVHVVDPGDAASVDILSSIHGIVASGVGPGSYTSLSNAYGVVENLTVVSSDDAGCVLPFAPITSMGSSCVPVLVPYAGGNTVTCGHNTFLRDHSNEANYFNHANGFTVLQANGTATIHISGEYDTQECCDLIRIYDGVGPGGMLLQTYSGTGTANFTGAPGQTLTVVFSSNQNTVRPGFNFQVSYSGACACTSAEATISVTEDCNSKRSTATVHVSSVGDGSGVNIISSIHGTIASGVGAGSYPSLPNFFWTQESFTVVGIGAEGCALATGPVTSTGNTCPAFLVPQNGINTTAGFCGMNMLLRDHAGLNNYSNNANGAIVLPAYGTAVIHLVGDHGLDASADWIGIYDGAGTSGTLLQTYTGTGMVDLTGAPGQTLTLRFVSNGSSVNYGFNLLVTYSGDCDSTVPTDCAGVPGGSALPGTPCDDGDANTINDVFDNDCGCAGVAPHVLVSARVYLEGSYDAGIGLMRDDLRALGLVPIVEPYTGLGHGYVNGGGETTAPSVLGTIGVDAIVDWVIVELRDKNDPTMVLHSRAALLQRDGDVVDVDGVSAVGAPLPADAYHVTILHRNHLGCMTAQPVQLGTVATVVDLTAASTTTYGTAARKSMSGTVPVEALWAGDVNFDGQLRYAGSNNDRDLILQAIGGTVPTNTTSGQYRREDVNMDGVVRYAGSGNDRDPILQNVGGSVPTNVRTQQVP